MAGYAGSQFGLAQPLSVIKVVAIEVMCRGTSSSRTIASGLTSSISDRTGITIKSRAVSLISLDCTSNENFSVGCGRK